METQQSNEQTMENNLQLTNDLDSNNNFNYLTLMERGEDNLPTILHALSLSSLLSNDPIVDSTLSLLTVEQLSSMERVLTRVKRNKKNSEKKQVFSMSPNGPYSQEDIEEREEDNKNIKEINHYLPVVYMDNNIEYMTFVYSSKGCEQSYTIRIDIDYLETQLDQFPTIFKVNNCLYPRAFCNREEYNGNRWEYETMCNSVGWRLAHLNLDLLDGKRGLLQRAVDSYRNRLPGLQSRRVARQEKMLNGTLRRRTTPVTNSIQKSKEGNGNSSNTVINKGNEVEVDINKIALSQAQSILKSLPIPNTLQISLYFQNTPHEFTIQIDLHKVDLNDISLDFRKQNAVYPRSLPENQGTKKRKKLQFEVQCNEWGWKLAYLNKNLFNGNILFLQRALDCYRELFTLSPPRPYRLK
ncbi:hypothetical protein K502DRAFT_50568 [Neoconidiobolus thromboides FSU 785]|nr:hypothetical protein K502DRAFT_50568 [Neoconidiobolus thromboides FSU 785]